MADMITLRTLLEALKNKVDEDYADRVDKALRMRTIDKIEAEAIKKLDMIDAVIELAEQYYPTSVDTDLVKLQFQKDGK